MAKMRKPIKYILYCDRAGCKEHRGFVRLPDGILIQGCKCGSSGVLVTDLMLKWMLQQEVGAIISPVDFVQYLPGYDTEKEI